MRRALFAVGLVSLLGQVVLLREGLVAAYGVELTALLGLGLWLAGTALGAAAGRALGPPTARGARGLLLALGALVPLLAVFLRVSRLLLGGVPGAYLPALLQGLVAAAAFLPPGLLSGILFQRCAALGAAGGGTFSRAYAVECAGSAAGGLLVTGLLGLGAPNLAAALLAAFLAAGAGLAAFPGDGGRRWVSAGLAAASLACLFAAPRLDFLATRAVHPDLAAVRDTPYGRLARTRREGQAVLYWNDALVSDSQSRSAEAFVHPAALAVRLPRRALVLGGAAEGMAALARAHGFEAVEAVELDERAVSLAAEHLAEAGARPLPGPPPGLRFGDPRRALAGAGPWDLILSAALEPDSGQSNRFYTEEFFRECRGALAPGGVLALRLRSAENLWSPALVARNASVHRALSSVFEDVLVLPGATAILLASPEALPRDPEVLAARLEARGLRSPLVTAPYLRYLLTNDRLAATAAVLEASSAPANRDARPVCYSTTVLLWASRFVPRLGLQAPGPLVWTAGRAAGAAVLFLAAAGAGLALARRGGLRGTAVAFVAGFAGMVLQAAFLLFYQAGRGALFGHLGVLLASFMAGLAAGAWAAGAALRGGGSRRFPALLCLAGSLFCLGAAALFSFGSAPGLLLSGLMLLACGALTGAFYPSALSLAGEARGAGLYAADVAGGVAGAIAGGLVLLPFAGLPASAGLLALLFLALAAWAR
jgi:spermidine synthase